MLPKAARMRRRTDFTAAIRGGSRYGRPLLVGHLLVRDGCDEPPKAGFIVSRAVGEAVMRNKVRRRLRHLVAGYLHSLPGGSLLVLRANPLTATAGQAALAAELDVVVKTLLRRHGATQHGATPGSGVRPGDVRRGNGRSGSTRPGDVRQRNGVRQGAAGQGGAV